MHDSKISTSKADQMNWCKDCLVISELNAKTIWVYAVDQVKCPRLKSAAEIANHAIVQLLQQVKTETREKVRVYR